jgi:hypothetical protein
MWPQAWGLCGQACASSERSGAHAPVGSFAALSLLLLLLLLLLGLDSQPRVSAHPPLHGPLGSPTIRGGTSRCRCRCCPAICCRRPGCGSLLALLAAAALAACRRCLGALLLPRCTLFSLAALRLFVGSLLCLLLLLALPLGCGQLLQALRCTQQDLSLLLLCNCIGCRIQHLSSQALLLELQQAACRRTGGDVCGHTTTTTTTTTTQSECM